MYFPTKDPLQLVDGFDKEMYYVLIVMYIVLIITYCKIQSYEIGVHLKL